MNSEPASKKRVVCYRPILVGSDDEVERLFHARLPPLDGDSELSFIDTLLKNSHEWVLCRTDDGRLVIHVIARYLDVTTLQVQVGPLFELGRVMELTSLVQPIASAMIEGVPIRAESAELQAQLMALEREIVSDGFPFLDPNGQLHRAKITKYSGINFNDSEALVGLLKTPHLLEPAQVAIVADAAVDHLAEAARARAYVAKIEAAIGALEAALVNVNEGEAVLQRCLTDHPILFGTQYRRMIAKHRLGSEFEMDFALERFDGIFELVEIEACTHNLYTRGGNPSAALLHAEQQVLDWQDWIEEKSFYARERLPDIRQPIGYVIIGRRESLSATDRKKLARRNVSFRGHIQVLTYDDILDKCKTLLQSLRGRVG